jgi:predicted enzyme related to lactoylglutathione lyase
MTVRHRRSLRGDLRRTAVPAGAQTKTLPYDHIHLNVPDPAAASAWYEKNIPGARRITEAPDRLMYGSTRLMFLVTKNPVEPSAGSAVDHLGFSVKDLDATLKAMEAAGVKITAPARDLPGISRSRSSEDPWGTRMRWCRMPSCSAFITSTCADPTSRKHSSGCSAISAASVLG